MDERTDEMSAGEALVAGGAALVRAENEGMSVIAIQRPRDEKKIHKAALAELELVPRLAARAYYTLPFKNHVRGCRKRKTCNCPTNYVRGMSVKGAMSLARRWGNCAATVRVIDDTLESATLEGVFLDLETNARFCTPKVVSKWRTWDGKRVRLWDADLEKLIAATASKAKRNAILDGLPDWLVEDYYQTARRIALEEETKANAGSQESLAERIVKAFGGYSVTAEMIERRLGHPLDKLTDEEVLDLRGIMNALRDKEITVEEAFEPEPEELPKNESDVDTVLAGGAKTTGGVEAPLFAATAPTSKASSTPRVWETPDEEQADLPRSGDSGPDTEAS